MTSKQRVWDNSYEPLIKMLLHKKGVRTKEAVEVGRKMVTIVRGKDIKEFLTKDVNLPVLKKKFPKLFEGAVISESDVNAVGKQLVSLGFLCRVIDQAFKTQQPSTSSEDAKQSESPSKEPTKTKKSSWPERVARAQLQEFDPKGFYMVTYEADPTLKYVLLGGIVLVVLLLCMFPAWPMYLKIAAWHVLVAFSTALIALTIVRLILFVIVWCFGADFWIFPNMNDEYLGIVDSFKPAYSFEWRKDEKLMLTMRFVSIIMIAAARSELAVRC